MTTLYYQTNRGLLYYDKSSSNMIQFDIPVAIKHRRYIFVVQDKKPT